MTEQHQGKAIMFMIAALFFFSLMDVSAKALTPRIGIVPTLWARYAGQMLVVSIIIAPRINQVRQTQHLRLHLFRSALLLMATGFFFAGISRIELTEASALMLVNPVFITLGAALFLGESLGPRRIAGIIAALIGAMIVLRPGSDVFSPNALFPLAAALCYSGYALLTRHVGPDEDVWTALFYAAVFGTVVLSIAVVAHWQMPDRTALALMVAVAICGTLGQMFLIHAFSTGQAAMLAPFSYVTLIFASIWSILFFAEHPDLWTIVGATVICSAGLYVWSREIQTR